MRIETIRDVPTSELATMVSAACVELSNRTIEDRQRALDAAWEVWPFLVEALRATGRSAGRMGLGGCRTYPSENGVRDYGPCFPSWANQPVVSAGDRTFYDRPSTKREALRRALIDGDREWRTIGELWLWVGGGGPIVDRALQMHGYGPKEKVPVGYR